MKPWLTYAQAAKLTGRSKRTIQRWAAAGEIDTIEADDGTTRVRSSDVLRVESAKTAYRQHPGRHAA
ncbi:helix-turn-helix domain-containing protein [Humibacter ginsenosidimutans]|uniref:Helix-turn-helix domain-containing protein n=1 Tax=Humibacter ginsenosidimutans TaxID=2599293 RepID=A0A5B8M628_9MICO|nr:helix-turn-helix domain-containing protein [Humibacter ginsenosidimutans]QDZ15793.1 helix-turn-helix domain-containing protein [Humibacter ginsenosidimutans]